MALGALDLETVERVLGRALIDAEFRKELSDDPEKIMKILGYGNLSDEAVRFFKALATGDFPVAAQEVEDRLGGRPVIALWF